MVRFNELYRKISEVQEFFTKNIGLIDGYLFQVYE